MNDASDGLAERRALGLDIGGHGLKGVLVDSEGTLLAEQVLPLGEAERGLDAVESQMRELVAALKGEQVGPGVLSIGVGVPGFFDVDEGLLRSSPNFPGWEDVPLAARFSDLLGQSVAVENDANCAVLGERFVGAAQGLDNVLLLTLGTGVGTGALVGGRLLRGSRGLGAEGGHISLYPGGRRCGCGLRGCLEAYASGPGLAVTAREAWFEEGNSGDCPATTALDVFAAESEAGGPDPEHWASRAIERYCLDVAQGVAGMVHLLAPQTVVLAGGISGAFQRIGPPIEEALSKRCIAAFREHDLTLTQSTLGDYAGAYGAAWLALHDS